MSFSTKMKTVATRLITKYGRVAAIEHAAGGKSSCVAVIMTNAAGQGDMSISLGKTAYVSNLSKLPQVSDVLLIGKDRYAISSVEFKNIDGETTIYYTLGVTNA